MGRDLFAPKINGHSYLKDDFRWVVAIFMTDGAVEVIKRANENDLKTFYPIRKNIRGEYKPLWANYLFIQFIETVTIDLCRTTSKFIKVISARDDEGIIRPILVRKDAIAESLRLMTQGKFDAVTFKRRFHGRGAIVRIIDGPFLDKIARLEIDVLPEMKATKRLKLILGA